MSDDRLQSQIDSLEKRLEETNERLESLTNILLGSHKEKSQIQKNIYDATYVYDFIKIDKSKFV